MAIHHPDATPVAIGTLVTTSNFVTSLYCDNKLFFQHQRFEEDLAIHPEWTKGTSCPDEQSCKVCPVDVACGGTFESA